ncbi:MAG: YhgN family NAAT transporter [Gammaproteobacteria bacterium]
MTIMSAAVMLFLIMDPLGNLPVFLSVLKNVPAERRQKIIVRELLMALVVMLIFLFAGRHILAFLHVRQEAVSISGGIILFIIGLKMIFPGRGSSWADDSDGDSEPFLVPLAIPMVAGPSLLAALMLITSGEEGRMLDWVIALMAAWFVTAVILFFSNTFFKLLGHRGLIAVERLMGMVIIMISVQMFLDGIIDYWPKG